MKMTCQTSDYQLSLGDLRRLVNETGLWSDDCLVEVFASTSVDRITVQELDSDRKSKPPPNGNKPAVKAVAK